MTRFTSLRNQPKSAKVPSKVSNKDKCDELIALQEHLTEWEVSFVKSIRSYCERGFILSEKQQDTLDKIVTNVAERME